MLKQALRNNHRAVVKKRRPERMTGLLVCESVIGPLERHLQATGLDRCEEAALLAGYVAGKSVGVVTTALLPYTQHAAGGCSLPLDVIAGCHDFVKRKGQILLAQIHTHPGRAFHSWTDDRWAISDSAGFFSIVVPCFARFGLTRLFGGGSVIHERKPTGEWRQLPLKEVRRRFHVIPADYAVV